eukprot:scaffold1704_cov246-Pinguiococcus_pyrenoidosus.AAC.15
MLSAPCTADACRDELRGGKQETSWHRRRKGPFEKDQARAASSYLREHRQEEPEAHQQERRPHVIDIPERAVDADERTRQAEAEEREGFGPPERPVQVAVAPMPLVHAPERREAQAQGAKDQKQDHVGSVDAKRHTNGLTRRPRSRGLLSRFAPTFATSAAAPAHRRSWHTADSTDSRQGPKAPPPASRDGRNEMRI